MVNRQEVVNNYDENHVMMLRALWMKILEKIWTFVDHKKIVSFLLKVSVIWIDEDNKKVIIWVPNEFVKTQVNKFFKKDLGSVIKEIYNNQFDLDIVVFQDFFDDKHPLLCNVKKMFAQSKSKEKMSNIPQKMKNTLNDYFGILLEANYTFDNCVVWEHNRFAVSAAKAVADDPGNAYNPFFIYGNVGLGKTHLMHSIANEMIKKDPNKVILYLPSGKLIDEIVFAIKSNKLQNLIKKLEDVDALFIDDVQFLANKEKTQEIFHNIFNDFHAAKKQVVLSSDRPPKELMNMEPRLKSRFGLGLVADIQAPDYETRLAIAQTKLSMKDEYIEDGLLAMLVSKVKDNVRELEWAINILITRKQLQWDIWESDVENCLQTLWYEQERVSISRNSVLDNKKSVKNFEDLVKMVSNYYEISVEEIRWDSRKKEISVARQILMFIWKKHFSWTYEKIGDFFGGKNHATVIYAVDNIAKKMKKDSDILHDYNVFCEWIGK